MIYDTLNQSPTGLRTVGIIAGAWLVVSHAVALGLGAKSRAWLKTFPFNTLAGYILMAVAAIWTYGLFQGLKIGPLSIPRMDMGEFYTIRGQLTFMAPVAAVLVSIFCKEFLSVRALGCVILLVAVIPLDAAFLKEPLSRLLLVSLTYVSIVFALFWIGMPYLLRDHIDWATASTKRWTMLCGAGIAYGIAILACALLWW